MGARSCIVFRNPAHKGSPGEALGKAYINLHPYTPPGSGSLGHSVKLTSALIHIWSFMRREPMGPLQFVRAGSSLACAGNYSGPQLGVSWEYAVPDQSVGPPDRICSNPHPALVLKHALKAAITIVTRVCRLRCVWSIGSRRRNVGRPTSPYTLPATQIGSAPASFNARAASPTPDLFIITTR
jgi:hypothetical protein